MTDLVNPLLQWLNANPHWAGIVTFIISAGESIAIIGTIVPGSIMMTALGALAGAGVIPLWSTLVWAMLGAVVGDGISYWIGYYFKDNLANLWPFRNNPEFLKKGANFIHKYGVMGVFIGRFIGPVRAIIPVVAGMLGMQPIKFTIANIASAIGWAPAYMLPGIVLGAISFELPPDIALHFVLVLFLITLFVLLCMWFVYKLFRLVSKQIEQLQINIWNFLERKPYLSPFTYLLKYKDPTRPYGQLTLVFYFLLSSFLFLCLAIYLIQTGVANISINNIIFHFFRGIRNPGLDGVMMKITLLGQGQIIVPVVGLIFLWLLYIKRPRAAFHAIGLAVLAVVSAYILKNLIQSPRPWGIVLNTEGESIYSMPSGHTTLATTIYLGLAFILASSVRPTLRWLIYVPAILITLAIGISRMYLGMHWFTDVIGAWLLSSALFILVIISFNRRVEKPFNLWQISAVGLIAMLLSYNFYYYRHITQLEKAYTELDWPTLTISAEDWWKDNNEIPALRVSLFGIPSEYINIEWAGKIKNIQTTLWQQGWLTPPERDWISILHRLTNVRSTEFLPLISPQYLDKKPALILIRTIKINNENKIFVLRMWKANRLLDKTGQELWVGTVGFIPQAYHWLYRRHRPAILISSDLVFPKEKQAAKLWQWKTLELQEPFKKSKQVMIRILLVKAQ